MTVDSLAATEATISEADDVVAKVVYTGFDQTGSFECANEKLNQVQQNSLWGLRSSAHGIPTDCCQRKERLGWTGDGHLVVDPYLLNFDAERFQWKWMRDHGDDQSSDGIPITIRFQAS